jgi:hypothetical protein
MKRADGSLRGGSNDSAFTGISSRARATGIACARGTRRDGPARVDLGEPAGGRHPDGSASPTVGATVAAGPSLDLSLVLLEGLLPGGDRRAAFLGVSAKISLW